MIFYICDRKACENCNPECKHTTDISHSVTYKGTEDFDASLTEWNRVTMLDATDYWEKDSEECTEECTDA